LAGRTRAPPKDQRYLIIYNKIDDWLPVRPILRPTSVVRDIYFQDRAAAACRSRGCLARQEGNDVDDTNGKNNSTSGGTALIDPRSSSRNQRPQEPRRASPRSRAARRRCRARAPQCRSASTARYFRPSGSWRRPSRYGEIPARREDPGKFRGVLGETPTPHARARMTALSDYEGQPHTRDHGKLPHAQAAKDRRRRSRWKRDNHPALAIRRGAQQAARLEQIECRREG